MKRVKFFSVFFIFSLFVSPYTNNTMALRTISQLIQNTAFLTSRIASPAYFSRKYSTDDSKAVLVSRDSTHPGIAIVTLNRPDKVEAESYPIRCVVALRVSKTYLYSDRLQLNALTVEVGKEFQSAIEELIPDEQLRAVVITGTSLDKTGSFIPYNHRS